MAEPAPQEDSGTELALELLSRVVDQMGGQQRPGQQEMIRQVSAAIESDTHLLVQAGTGTGKSLGYLIPLVVHALESERPSIVATATLALQSQIVSRDLPKLLAALEPVLPRAIDVALIKGRSNYVCKHKVSGGFPTDEAEDGQLFALGEDASMVLPGAGPATSLGKEVVRLREWAEETETGDRDELMPGVSDRAWRQVSVTARECLGFQKCPLASECFSERARARGAEADVVVTNHALLAINTFGDAAVLPESDVVVVDEAHELVDRVTGAVSAQLSAAMVTAAAAAARRHTAISVDALHSAAEALEAALSGPPAGWMPDGVNAEQGSALTLVRDAARVALSDSKGDAGQPAAGGRQQARARLQEVLDVSERILLAGQSRDGQSDDVLWLARAGVFNPQQGYAAAADSEPGMLHVAPLSVAMTLRESLFGNHTVVLTSATLAIGSAFQPTAGALGLLGAGAPSWNGVDVGSPFDYPRQGMLYVAAHLDKPGRGNSPEQLDELQALIQASGGGALCLFSSRKAAEEAADAMRKRTDLNILCQGESSMGALIRQFEAEPDTCLFGTMSLWQGVDVQGTSCRLVTIDRIPFPRPDDPLMTARTREVARNGGNGFMSVSATHAAIRLAQGAGRLIRSSQDRGVVAVLDSRLATARYGGFLRSALPPFWATTDKALVLGALKRLAPAD
ncbi:ATP-dependent DNA helicase [Psychromicrobium xiongbiense]|uniref:ATP-dependent DNA helicase n=1 Tax=Psychromicrobium xiongbiense TaxID=3051184 RepID=UPI00255306D3|nr:ATP-dependent DNA helicase [Psychromicrobium sp. YIM S02556]